MATVIIETEFDAIPTTRDLQPPRGDFAHEATVFAKRGAEQKLRAVEAPAAQKDKPVPPAPPAPAAPEPRSGARTRVFAFFALCVTLGAGSYVGYSAYHVATDSFVAPMILSPDSDVVLANKQRMVALDAERVQAKAQATRLTAEMTLAENAMQRLAALKSTASNALGWTAKLNAQRGRAGAGELRTLKRQRSVLHDMQAAQQEIARKAEHDLKAGVIQKIDRDREVDKLHQIGLALIENERLRVQSDMANFETALRQQSLAGGKDAPPMPEIMTREEQLIRLELELSRLAAENGTRASEKRVLEKRIAEIDELEAQLKARPISQAIEKKLVAAFVPYTQLPGVRAGSQVYQCTWGIFNCQTVGTISEVVPGEVVMADPWGGMARGQYAVLDLTDRESAKVKVLRVRGSESPINPVVAAR
jgi:hypothetical protein